MSRPPSRPNQRSVGPPRADFICKPKFGNSLPDVPFEGKFLPCPFVPLSRFIDYKGSALEKEYKFEVQCEMDMGILIDQVDPETYTLGEHEKERLDEKDQILLEDETNNASLIRRSLQHSKVVPWMRKTEYISSEFNRFGVTADRQELKIGYHLKKSGNSENLYRDRNSQLQAIEKTFEDVKQPVKKHYNKKGVVAVEEMPIFPGFELWKYLFAHVIFDADPANATIPEELRKNSLELSQIVGMTEGEEQCVGHFTPTVETMQKMMEDTEAGHSFDSEHKYQYELTRKYQWNVRNKASKGYEQNEYMMHFKEGKVYYNELDTRVKLTRRRAAQGQPKIKQSLSVNFVEPSTDEMDAMNKRLQDLMNIRDDEDEEAMEEDQEEDDENGEAAGAKKAAKSDSEKSGSDSSSESDKDSDSEKSGKSAASDSDDEKKSSADSD